MLKRRFYQQLVEWKNAKENNCLLIRGARQIGKTYLIDYFGKTEYKSYLYINFIETPNAASIFDGELSTAEITKRITLQYPTFEIIDGNTLLFLDEIQECPNARTALKFLAIDKRFDTIASGSMLGIHYKPIRSIPVGYEKQLQMYALDFEEFLWAMGYDTERLGLIKDYFTNLEKIPASVNDALLDLLRQYIVVGGMPAVVADYVQNHHFGRVFDMQQAILDSYYDDISKYASTTEKPKVKNCYLSIPRQLAKENKKFQFSVVEKRSTARKYENSIEWLRDAGLIVLVNNVSTPSSPLTAYEKGDYYKAYLSDIGLLTALYGFEIKNQIYLDEIKGPAKGGIYENVICDMLTKRGYKLRYFRNDSGSIEIEFLIENHDGVIPIEVKAKNGSTLSLNKLLENDDIKYGYKLISGNTGVDGKKITLPLYMAMFI